VLRGDDDKGKSKLVIDARPAALSSAPLRSGPEVADLVHAATMPLSQGDPRNALAFGAVYPTSSESLAAAARDRTNPH